jgi:hypothetical protein
VDERDLEMALEGLDHLARLVLAEQTVVDEDAGELVADRLVHEQRRDCGVDTARESAQHPRASDLRADPLDLLLDHRGGRPRGRRARDAVEEVLQHLVPVGRVHDLGMELDAVEPALGRLEGGDRRRRRRSRHAGTLRRGGHRVSVAHPDDLILGDVLEERAALRVELGPAEL